MALALFVHAPSLGAGYMADDFGVQLVLDGRVDSPTWKPWSLYDFGTFAGVSAHTLESGAFPWWTDSDWRVRFFRPLSSLSLWFDRALFGASPVGGHAMSLCLFALLLFAARRLYLRLGLSPPAALAAIVILAFDSSALVPVGWIANRNSLLEGLFAVLAIHAALETVARPTWQRALLALSIAVLATASKESGLHVFLVLALLFARERRHSTHARFFSAAAMTCVEIAVVYTLVYARSGFGSNVQFYPMPWSSPGEFAHRAFADFVCAPIAAVAPFSLDLLVLAPAKFWTILLVALILGAPVVVFIARRLRHVPNAGFLLAWGALALLPQAGAPPSDRLLFTPMIAWSALIAMYLAATLASSVRATIPAFEWRFAWSIAAASTILSGLVTVVTGVTLAQGSELMRNVIRDADVGSQTHGARDAFLMQASPSSMVALSPVSVWRALGGSEDVRFHALQCGRRALSWTRSSDAMFSLETLDEPFLTQPFEGVFLTHDPTGRQAGVWRSAEFTVRGTPDADGNLRRIEIELSASLDDPRWRFLVFDGKRLAHHPAPAIGQTVLLERGYKDPFLP